MKKLLSVICFFSGIYLHVFAQSCLPQGIQFTRQGQIDSFQINFPGCVDIEGGFSVRDDNITNLYGLNLVQSVGGMNIWYTKNLTSLSGLESLKSINGLVQITSNDRLQNVTALSSLEIVKDGLRIQL